jgi:hypothetical protein
VWITHPKTVLPLTHTLRHTLIEVGCARQASEGQQTKTEMIYGRSDLFSSRDVLRIAEH